MLNYLNDEQNAILNTLRAGRMYVKDIFDQCGVSKKRTHATLIGLAALGVIIKSGAGRGTCYEINPDILTDVRNQTCN